MLGIPAPALQPRERGFSIIEVVIAIALIALLLVMGLPSLGLFLDNQKIRAATDAMYGLLQQARAEAAKQNTPVEFVTFNDPIDPNDFTFINSVVPVAGGTNWAVRVPIPGTAPTTYQLITARSGAESSGSGTASIVLVTGGAPIITFNGFGGTNGLAGTTTFQFSRVPAFNPDLACAPAGAITCLNITVTTGGQVKVCDPRYAAPDTRAC